jgi:hypothetical protein
MDWTNISTRFALASLPACVLIFSYLISSSFSLNVNPTSLVHRIHSVKSLFNPFLTVPDAEALDPNSDPDPLDNDHTTGPPLWRTLALTFPALLLTLIWLSYASFALLISSRPIGGYAILISLTWLFATLHPILRPSPTPPYTLFTLYIFHLMGGILLLGGALYDANISGVPPDGGVVFALVVNLLVILTLLGIVLAMPVGIPSDAVDVTEIVNTQSLFFHLTRLSFDSGIQNLPRGLHVPLWMAHLLLGVPAHRTGHRDDAERERCVVVEPEHEKSARVREIQ